MTVITGNLHIKVALLLFVSGLFFFTVGLAAAGRKEIRVAVATNFIRTMDEFASLYEKETGIRVKRSSSATGMLYSQIVNSAPFDIFLAADEERPELLYLQGLCGEPFVYASGSVVLWSKRKDLAETENWRQVIVQEDISRIAMANPETAPYGEAAMQAIKKADLEQELHKRLVYGQNVGQAFQYGQQGAADLAFVAISFALSEHGRKGKTWLLPEAPPVLQKGCILKSSMQRQPVQDFIAYLQTDQAKIILSEYGYE
jgi:molybdate transport system substrate-binding protein